MAKPILKWAGGKSMVLPRILDLIRPENYERYVDLFCGSLTVPLSLSFERMLLNDINRPLIHTYQTVQNDLPEILEWLEVYNGDDHNNKDSYNHIRDLYNADKNNDSYSEEMAARFIYLNKRSFNGLYRENRQGQLNVPYREYNSPIYERNSIEMFHKWSTHTNIEWRSTSYRNITPTLTTHDIIYLDPPYYRKDGTTGFTAYWRDGFGVEDQKILAEEVREMDRRGIHFILSNTPCDQIRHLYTGFRQDSFNITRSMRSGKGKTSSNEEDNEILITNIP